MNVFSGLRYLLNEGGVRSLWRGNGVNVVKIAPESALKFMAYEQVGHLCTSYVSRFSHVTGSIQVKRLIKRDQPEISLPERFLAGSAAGSISQSCIYPLEVSSSVSVSVDFTDYGCLLTYVGGGVHPGAGVHHTLSPPRIKKK